jgi:hypothetical protein
MSALVSDQFRILNASNFIESLENDSYYVWVGLSNPGIYTGFARDTKWDGPGVSNGIVPNPTDNLDYSTQYQDTLLFGKRITSSSVRRAIKRVDWVSQTRYDMYRHDYNIENLSPISQTPRLYDSNYYVITDEYKVYICIENGSSGIKTTGNPSEFKPTFTDLEPSSAGTGEDGYIWKYLFTVSPGDIVKFDSTEYITLPNDWDTSTDSQIVSVRENGNSSITENQIKTVYIETQGIGYSATTSGGIEVDILGDGTGGTVLIETNSAGNITNTTVSNGGKDYTYGIVDLGSLQPGGSFTKAKLIPIIPPSKGHGYDLYKELGADKVLIYARFDDSTRDFPIDTKFCQIGIVKNPTKFDSSEVYTDGSFTGLYSVKILGTNAYLPEVGEKFIQQNTSAVGYVASYDSETKVLKYFKDRSLYYNQTSHDQTDYVGVSSSANANVGITTNGGSLTGQTSGFVYTIDTGFSGITTTVNTKIINLGVNFVYGLANPEINKKSGDIIYIDNRPLIARNTRQKEDVKIILEF